MPDEFDSLSGKGLERIVEGDPTVVLELLDESLVDGGSAGSYVIPVDKELPWSRVDYVLRSELNGRRIVSGSQRPLCDVDGAVAYERPSKSVAFQLDDECGLLSSAGCEMVGESDAGQSFPSSSRSKKTDYGSSELESIARRRDDDVSERRVQEAGGMGLHCSSGKKVQHGVGTRRSKYYLSDSVNTLLKECFANNPPVQLDPHHQLTGMSSGQMIQYARAIGSEFSLATFEMLEDVLLKIGSKTGKSFGDEGSGQSHLFSWAGSTVFESVVSRSFLLCLVLQDQLVVILLQVIQQPCSSRQADANLGFSETQVRDITGSDSFKTLGKIRSDARKKNNLN